MATGGVLPATLKSLQHYMKIAAEHDKRNPVVAYYARMYVAQQGIKIDSKTPDARNFLIGKLYIQLYTNCIMYRLYRGRTPKKFLGFVSVTIYVNM